MTPPVVHVGLHKTGTTAIQTYLRDHERGLAKFGLRFPNGYLQLNCHFELPLCQLRLDRLTPTRIKGDDWQDEAWRRWLTDSVAADLRQPGAQPILSCEEFSLYRFPDEFEQLRELVGDATIILYLRDRDAWLDAMRAEILKYTTRSDDPAQFSYLEADSWQLDYPARLETWLRYFDDVHVLDYDAAIADDGSVIPSFLHEVGLPPPADVANYWLNAAGTFGEGRVPGTRWCGSRYGGPFTPTLDWQREFLARNGVCSASRLSVVV